MNAACTNLAFTGLGYPVIPIAVAAVACLVLGIIVLSAGGGHGHRRLAIVLMLALCVCAAVGIAGPSPATGASARCGNLTLVVTQSSNISDMGPGMPTLPIVGIVTNSGSHSIFVKEVVVRIAFVSKAPDGPAGACNPSDYVIESPRMAVAASVAPGASVGFHGARVGFSDRVTNQDACKGAIVHLAYDVDGA
jgi:hypothetical protein